MKILITGNLGYVGPGVVKHLRKIFPDAILIGYDMGYFANCLTNSDFLPENLLNIQYFSDVRNIPAEFFIGIDAVVNLAAISNDPMGKEYEEVTLDVNYKSSIDIAKKAKAAGVKSFVFASSCSVYGSAEEKPRDENSTLNPLTAYAKSKVFTENELKTLAGEGFQITSLRFSTACGMSDRLRLDLVLNDFVAGAIASKKITILSDGSPWRPLINVKDMALAIEWAISRDIHNGGQFLAINVGSDNWNYQIKELAKTVADVIPGVEVSINKDAEPDKRSYRVNFELFQKLAPNHQPKYDLTSTIKELKEGLEKMKFHDENFRDSTLMRLKVIKKLRDQNLLSEKLEWN